MSNRHFAALVGFITSASLGAQLPAPTHDHDDPVELDLFTVVSTATRTERLATEGAIRTELLGPELFRATGSPNLAAAIEYLPGARVEANCQNCGTAEVKLLGLGAGYNQLLFDGQPLFSGLAAVYGLEHIPTAFIERIEVVKGGASSLYGPKAVAGVINIIPREPVVNQVYAVGSIEAMDDALKRSGVAVFDWVDPAQRAATSLYGEYRATEAVDLNDDGFSEITEKDFYTVGTNTWFYPTPDSRVSAHYAYTWEERRGGDRFDLLPHETQITEALEHRWHRGGLFYEQDVSPDFSFKLGGSISQIERDSYYGGVGDTPLPGQTGYDATAYTAAVEKAQLLYGFTESTRYTLDSIFTWWLDQHTLSFGAQYKHDDVFDEKRNAEDRPLRPDGTVAARPGEDPIADGSFDNLGFYVQNEWDPAPAWTVIAGLRADKHSHLDEWILSPRAAVRHTVSSELTLRAAVSTGFRAPEIFDEDFHIEILDDPTRTRNAPDLQEERSVSYATGFIWTPRAADNRLQVDLEFYRTEIDDTFYVPDIVFTDARGAYKQRENAGGSVVQGIEANALYRLTDRLSLEGGIAYNDTRFDEAQEVIEGIFADRYIESPRWSGVAQLNYLNEDLVDVFLGVIYTGPMIAVNEADGFLNRETDTFFVIDLSVKKHFPLASRDDAPHLDLTVGVRNLLDERQDDLPSGPGRDPGYFYGPRFPRSLFVTLAYHF
ncbi:MAG: TonB-dependent receptor plug domain-containing protein [Opitutales bacterium]